MRIFYDAINATDAFVLGSPIYLGYVFAQAKLFLDRLFAYISPNHASILKKGLKGAIIF
jgi:multimeric flavodoxin WrbA